jgi:hypothetical protein
MVVLFITHHRPTKLCIIYNSSQTNKAIAVIDFGGTKTSTNGDFVVQFPAAAAATAIIRIA